MKHLNLYALILIVTLFASCVNRVEIPEEADKQLFVQLEMLRGVSEITAKVMTSNNLQGQFPIEHPEDVEMRIYKSGNFEELVNFVYDSDRELYVYVNDPSEILISNSTIVLEAFIVDEDISPVSSTTTVPKFNLLDEISIEILDEAMFQNELGENFWESTLRFNFVELFDNRSHFYQLTLNDMLTEKELVNGEPQYTFSGIYAPYEILEINSGQESIKQFNHKEGVFIDMDKFESDFFEFKIRSTIPVQSPSQVTDFIFPQVLAITEEHYDYHLGIHNINSSNNSIFNEPALFRSNIDGGIGIFSSCYPVDQKISIKR